MLRPSLQHPLLLLPLPSLEANTKSASDIQYAFAKSNINRVAFIRHGNTAPADVDFERTLTELGRSQSSIAGASYGTQQLYPYYKEAVLKLMEEEADELFVMPQLELHSKLYDGTMQPEGSRLFRSIGYAPLRQYVQNANEDDGASARCILGEYAKTSLDTIWDVVKDHTFLVDAAESLEERTLLFFAHAIYLPSAALGFATAIGCRDTNAEEEEDTSVDLILDTNTKEAEGYCVQIDTQTVSLLCRPES